MRPLALLLIAACALGAAPRPADPIALVRYARIEHAPLDEMSGLVRSVRYPGVFWTHNDSGDTARIFAIRADGQVIMPGWLRGSFYVGPEDPARAPLKPYPGLTIDGAVNADWEDIASDGDTLYLVDSGNNGNARRDLAVYALPEPNPAAVERSHVLKRIPIAYPDQRAFPDPADWQFDCEAAFVLRGKLHLLTKHRAPGKIEAPANGTKLYRLDTQFTDRVNVLRKLDALPDLGGWVTGASVSPDGRTLAVLCHAPVSSVWLFDLSRGGSRLLSGKARRLVFTGAEQCEAVSFEDDGHLIVGNEQRSLFRIAVADFAEVNPPR